MNHLMESYDLVQTLKDRLARQIRGRLMSARAAAAEHPELKRALLSRETIAEIVRQENRSFDVAGQAAQKGPSFFALHFKAQGEELHAREERNKGLPRYQLRPGWHDVIPRRDEKGSFTDNDEGCR
jgi:hypothetical protein